MSCKRPTSGQGADAPKLEKARKAFEWLRGKMVEAPMLRNFVPEKGVTVIVYANEWAVSAAIVQEHAKFCTLSSLLGAS